MYKTKCCNIWRMALLVILLYSFTVINSAVCFAQCKDNSIKVFQLPDGHTVIIKEVHTNPIVTVDTWIRTGSINENNKNNGVSHFLEHLIFKGTKCHKAGEADRILESKGAVYNAATSDDFTHFYTTIASAYAETAIDLQADMLLNAVFPEDELNRERNVVQEEIRRSLQDPNSILFRNLNTLLFKIHPYKYETLGTEEIIQNIPRQEIINYYHKWYTPSNMTTVIVGDVDTNRMLELIKEKFKTNCPGITAQSHYPREPYVKTSIEKVTKGKYNSGYMIIAFKGVPIWDKKENYALDLAAAILGEGRSSRLYQNVKENLNLVSSVSAGHQSLKDDSFFYVDANFEPDKYVSARQAIVKEINRLREGKISQEELCRAKTQLQRAYLYGNESVSNIAGAIGYSMTVGGTLDYYTKYIDEINKITINDIHNVLNKYVINSRMVTSVLLPENTPVSLHTAQESYKNVTKTALNNGMILITEKNNSNDIISLSVFIKGGQLIETTPGISDLISATLLKGTENRTAEQISKEMENSGIVISPALGPDYFEIKLKSTKADFDKAFCLLADIINNPTFKNNELVKAKGDIIQGIQESRDTPSSYAFEKFNRAMYPNHPYGYEGEILEKNLPKITRDDLVKFYKEYFIPQNMIVSVSGNVDGTDIIDKFSENFPQKQGEKINIDNLKNTFNPLVKNQITSVKQDTPAAWLLLGWPVAGITQEKDFASLKVINAVLGGGLSSRLFVDLREKQGLAYVVTSSYPSMLDNSFFVLYIGTKPDNLQAAKNGFLNEINRIKTEPLTATELNEAKQKITGQFALSQETNQDKAHILGAFESLGKGYKFTYEYPCLINSVTAEDVINTANKYFNNPYIISVIGPAKDVERLDKDFRK